MIEVTNLNKQFGKLVAVDNLSFNVEPGTAVALWGANGAGKTTALRCLLNLIPFKGTVKINGIDISRQSKEARRLIGFVPQDLTFHDDLSVTHTISFYAQLKKLPAGHDFSALLSRLQLDSHLEKEVGDLSGGLKQRLALALALLSDPPILLLDEPTASLDFEARDDFLRLLTELKHAGKTIVFSSHRLEEITAVADRVLLLSAGKLVVDTPPHQLEERLGWSVQLHLYLAEQDRVPAMTLLGQNGVTASQNGRGVFVKVAPGKKGQVMRILYDGGIPVQDFTVE